MFKWFRLWLAIQKKCGYSTRRDVLPFSPGFFLLRIRFPIDTSHIWAALWLVPTGSGPPAQRYSFLLGKTCSLHCAVWVGTFFVILRYMLYPRNTRDCGCVQKLSRDCLAMFPRAPIGGFRSRHPILSRPQTDAIVSWPYMHLKANGMICWSWTRVHGSAELWPADIDLESHPSQYLPTTYYSIPCIM